MTRNLIRKLFNIIGLDVHRYYREPGRFGWLKEFNIKTILDIGANVGQFAGDLRECLPVAQIYSFEPLKECFNKLVEKERIDKKFKAFNFALGDHSGETVIHKSSYTPSSSILEMTDTHKNLYPKSVGSAEEKITIKRLDDIVQKLDLSPEILIKIDAQGYEDKIMSGGMETLRRAKVCIIETCFVPLYKNQSLFGDIYNQLRDLGFSYHSALGQKIDPKTGAVVFEDSIFLRE